MSRTLACNLGTCVIAACAPTLACAYDAVVIGRLVCDACLPVDVRHVV